MKMPPTHAFSALFNFYSFSFHFITYYRCSSNYEVYNHVHSWTTNVQTLQRTVNNPSAIQEIYSIMSEFSIVSLLNYFVCTMFHQLFKNSNSLLIDFWTYLSAVIFYPLFHYKFSRFNTLFHKIIEHDCVYLLYFWILLFKNQSFVIAFANFNIIWYVLFDNQHILSLNAHHPHQFTYKKLYFSSRFLFPFLIEWFCGFVQQKFAFFIYRLKTYVDRALFTFRNGSALRNWFPFWFDNHIRDFFHPHQHTDQSALYDLVYTIKRLSMAHTVWCNKLDSSVNDVVQTQSM